MNDNRILIVYNICQKDRDNTNHYINAIKSILNQDYPNSEYKLIVSACMNSIDSLNRLKNEFGNKIEIIRYNEPYTVNITFNKSVQESVKKFGRFEGYLYVDSGIIFDNPDILKTISDRMNHRDTDSNRIYSMIAVQVSVDSGVGEWFKVGDYDDDYDYLRQTDYIVKNQDLIIPVGKAVNLHVQLFSDEVFSEFDTRIIPDVFKAHCSESVFSFLNSVIKRKWIVIKDLVVYHNHNVDGGSTYFNAQSETYGGSWNNLLFGRNALDFVRNEEAIDAGLGYEEIRSIMIHMADKFDESGYSKCPEKLKAVIMKYLYLTKEELDYDNIKIWM